MAILCDGCGKPPGPKAAYLLTNDESDRFKRGALLCPSCQRVSAAEFRRRWKGLAKRG